MADNENKAKLGIEINAVANKSSAEQAGKEIVDGVNKAVGNKGHVKVPVDITVPIDKSKDKLTKAQNAIVKEINKMTKEGFVASGKNIDTLTSKFNEFTETFDKAGKGRRNKIFVEIRKQVEDLQKAYDKLKTPKQNKKPKITGAKTRNVKTKYDKYLDEQENYSNRAKGAGEKAALKKELDYVRKNKSLTKSSSNIKNGPVTKKTILATEYGGPYEIKGARQAELSRREADKKNAATLKVTKPDKETFDKIWNEATSKNKYNLTASEKAEGLKDAILPSLAKILGGLEKGRDDVSQDDFFKTLEAIFRLNQEAGKATMKSITDTVNMTLHKYYNTDGSLGSTGGEDKTAGTHNPEVVEALKGLLDKANEVQDKVIKEIIELENIEKPKAKRTTRSSTGIQSNSIASQVVKDINANTTAAMNKVNDEAKNTTKAVKSNTVFTKIGNTKEAVDSGNEQKIEKENKDINKDTARAVKFDETTGFNTDEKADTLISLVRSILNVIQTKKTEEPQPLALPEGRGESSAKSLGEIFKDAIRSGLTPEQAHQKIADISNQRKGKLALPQGPITAGPTPPKPPKGLNGDVPPYENKVQKSRITASPIKTTIWDKVEAIFEKLIGTTKKYDDILNATAEEQDRMAAERIKNYGLNNGRNPNDTGDIASIRRALYLFRSNKRSIEANPELLQNIKLTPGIDIDTTKVTKALSEALSGKQMRNAQMGGSIPRQILGAMTGFLGMPSLEKSRAQADGLNQILGDVNKALQSVLSTIQMKETELSGMEKAGDVKFDDTGKLISGTSAAKKTFADLEEEKLVLQTILADMNMVDQVVAQTGGKFSKLVKQLSFTSPILRDDNNILRNINAGLDKNGKALKFQTRTAEILNYTFQLISRSVGQTLKSWLRMLNPINWVKGAAGVIKNLFSDFGSYDVKWQRTMNVIKINFQRVMKPAMEWLAQKLVNIIGFFDIVSQRIQAAFGKVPISLFDQAGAQSEQIRRNLEEAANVSLGFDELHDIGTDQSGANDLTGEIYKPQLSQDWIDMATKLGDTLGGFFKGDLGFGDVCKVILELLGKLLGDIGKAIWDWFKQTSLGKWLTEHWKGLLAGLLAAFLAWKLLKIAGSTLFNAIFSKLLSGGTGIFKTLGTKFMDVFTGTQFGSDFVRGIKGMFTSGGMIGAFKSGGASLGTIFAQSLVAVAGVAIAGGSLYLEGSAIKKNTDYNLGLESVGGNDKDKKSNVGATIGGTLGAAGGGALAGLAIGGPIGAAIGAGIGAIAGVITSVLVPALEGAEVSARDMNNEMQNIEYYEGAVQGAQSQVDIFDEQLQLLKQSLDISTQSVYDQGEKLGISKTRMDELVQSTQDGTFNTGLLTDSETDLADSLTDLAEKQDHVKEVSEKLKDAQEKLLKAQTDLSIAQDIEAGNFELAAARIEVAEAQGVYSTEDATAKRIQLFKQTNDEQRKNLLDNLTPEQRTLMMQYTAATDKELQELKKIYDESSDNTRNALLSGVDQSVVDEYDKKMNSFDTVIKSHTGFWQGLFDTAWEGLGKIFGFNPTTYTYNAKDKYLEDAAKAINKDSSKINLYDDETIEELRKRKLIKLATGTNYIPNDGLFYLHQGEAVVPKKYNQPYQQGLSPEERAYMEQMINTMRTLDSTISQGINVKGEFRQRGSDLVATVEKNQSRQNNKILNNRVYAR